MLDLEKILDALKNNEKLFKRIFGIGWRVLVTLILSYFIASTITAYCVTILTDISMKSRRVGADSALETVQVNKPLNYTQLRRVVLERNLFNSDGELPEETSPDDDVGVRNVFDGNGACHKSSLNIELLGTIYLGPNGDSLATVREKGFQEADIYKIGDHIIENDQAIVFDILPNELVLNNNGTKECLKLEISDKIRNSVPASAKVESQSQAGRDMDPGDSGETHFVLDNSYVEESLGPGFSKILEAGRLVPHKADNQMIGFKLIGVKSDSLWRKIGLKSGDVITKVNDISMARADQGFALYQALEDDREIRVEFLRKGATPTNIAIEIK